MVRNNIMVAMTDLCIHHTAMVDSHVGRLSSCVRDRHELVRLQSLALLANLLMKDYVKWRGALFHRFLLALVDDSPAVRSLATYLLGDTLATKAPLLAYNHFVEALFVLNGCSEGLHAGRISSSLAADDTLPGGAGGAAAANELFCLRGASWEARAKRDTVYRTLLLRMSQEHKFSTAAKLCSEVLAGVADGALPLAECEEVLGDALRLLGSKEIKVSASRLAGGAGDDDGAEGGGGGGGPGGTAATQATAMAAEAAKAKGKIVSAMMKKHLVEGVVPVLIELKHMLQEARHPLLGPLMTCIASMLKDYKNEIEDILVADKQLAKEVLYDMRQTEAAAKAAAAAGKRPGTAGGAALPAAAAAAPSPAAACGRDGKGKRAMLPPGAMPGTPMAAEVLLVETAAAAGGANGSGPSRRPNSRRAAAATAAGSKTPGAAATAPPLFSLKTPGSGMAAAALPLKTPGGGAKTPSTGLTHNGDGQQPARMMATPAPLSAAAKKAAARGDKENAGSGRGVARALAATQSVVLPSPFAERPARQWNVQLEEPPAAGGGGAGGKGKLGSRLRQQSSAAAAAVESTMAGEVEEAAAGAKPAGRGGRAARGAAAKAAKRAAEQEVSEKSDDAFELPASDDNGEGSDSEPAAAARKRKGSAAGGAKRGKSAAARPSAAAAAKAAALAAAAAEAPVAEAGAAAARKRRGR